MPVSTKKIALKLAPKPTRKPKAQASEVPYVLKDNYVQVILEGKPFSLDNTHPTFTKMKKALQAKDWKAIPRLVTLAQSMIQASKGNVEVRSGVVYYKGTAIDDSLTQRIVDMVKGQKDINHMLWFMNNLYQNPEPLAIKEFFNWLKTNNLPITDDGHFLCYKSVDNKLRDQHTHKIDNSPGQVIMMPRDVADLRWRTQCSSGFHVCSKSYGLYGTRVMAVKVNPRDVIACEGGGKIRVLRYEVLKELGSIESDLFVLNGFDALENQVVVEIQAERKDLIQMILGSPAVKKLIRQDKIKADTIKKTAYARLKVMAVKYEVLPAEEQKAAGQPENMPYLEATRRAAGLTVGQVAKQMSMNYKVIAKLEKEQEPNVERADLYIAAVAALKGVQNLSNSAVSYPVPTVG